MSKPVSLSVHRNTRARRERHRISALMLKDARKIVSDKYVSGYAIVAWSRDGKTTSACWNLGGVPGNYMPDFVRGALRREQGRFDAEAHIHGRFPPDPDDAA